MVSPATLAVLVGLYVFAAAFLLLLYIAHLLDADDTRTVPDGVEHGAGYHTHPCWAEYDPAVLAAARLEVAAEMAAVRDPVQLDLLVGAA